MMINKYELDRIKLEKRRARNLICKRILQFVGFIGGGIAILMVLG